MVTTETKYQERKKKEEIRLKEQQELNDSGSQCFAMLANEEICLCRNGSRYHSLFSQCTRSDTNSRGSRTARVVNRESRATEKTGGENWDTGSLRVIVGEANFFKSPADRSSVSLKKPHERRH